MTHASDSAAVLFPGALGDFLCFLPTLCALRQRHCGPMLLIAKPALLELIRLPDTATASIDRREVADLFTVGAPVAADTRALLDGCAWIYSWSGFGDQAVAQRLARASGGRVSVHPFRGMRPREHAVDYYARCAGVVPSTGTASVIVEDASWMDAFCRRHGLDQRPTLVMHPGSGAARKNWQGFATVARDWRDRHADAVIVLYGPAEARPSLPAAAPVISLDGLSLPQVAALLRRCRLYLGNDSGISHLAATVRTPGIALFGPSDPAVWAPRGSVQVIHTPEPCGRCGPDVFCEHRLPAATVITALQTLRSAQR